MRFLFSCCFLILFHHLSVGQYFTIDTIKGISPYAANTAYIFPHIVSKKSRKAAGLINTKLMVSILGVDFDVDSGRQYNSIFEKVWGDNKGSIVSLRDISFEIINNDSNLLCIGISAEYCGAYCERGTRYFSYDSKSGEDIGLDKFFMTEGFQKILTSCKSEKNKRIQENLIKLKSSLNDKRASADKEYDKMAIDIYTECEKDGGDSEYEELNFSINKKKVILYIDSCLPHMLRALDEVDYTFAFDMSGMRDYLTDYGKSMLK